MADRIKDVMVFRYDPKKRYFLVSLHLENKPGSLGNLSNLLGIRGINILEGFFGGISYGPQGTVSFFVESTNERMDEGWLTDFLKSSVGVSGIEVKKASEGFLGDSLNFPLTWNSGDRAVLMRADDLRAMLNAVKTADPERGGAFVYLQGFNHGQATWQRLFGMHAPKTREGLAEMLSIYAATGWGRADLTDLNPGKASARVKVEESFECASSSGGKRQSNFIRGHLAGAFSVYFGREVKAVETRCVSSGDKQCEFIISP
jgi:hypothetical protein